MATVPFVAGAHDVPLDPHVRDECQPYGRRHVGIDNGCQSRCVRHVAQPRSAHDPVVYNADSTKTATYPPFIIAGHNRYYRYVRDGRKLPDGGVILPRRTRWRIYLYGPDTV